MANRAYLLSVDDPAVTWSDDARREILAEGINEIPVFWAAPFTPDDRQMDCYDGENEDGSPTDLFVPNWCVAAAAARQRLAALREPFGALLDAPTRELWEAFVGYVSSAEGAYLKTNAVEVWELDPDGYDTYWHTLLRPFTDPTAESLAAALRENDLHYDGGAVVWEDEEETKCKLAGADHIRDVPWFAD